MNGYYEFKVSASASASACESDRGRTTTTTNMTSSIVEVSAYAGSTHLFFRRNYINIVCMENLNNLLF